MSVDEALKVASTFGGGMWAGERCGCVTGGLMALGMKYGHTKPGDEETKNALLTKKAGFEKAFSDKNESLICKEILGYDISKPDELQKIMDEGLLQTLCPKLAVSACEILDEMLSL